MVLKRLLLQKKAAVVERWCQLILETYPADTARFLGQDADRFANPVGYTMHHEIDVLYDGIVQEVELDKLSGSVDNMVRVRSVQDLTPSQALSFVFLLKRAIRDELRSEIREHQLLEQLQEYDSRIDELALLAIDLYLKCREKVYDLRVNQAKAEREMALRLLERSGLAQERDKEQGLARE